MHPRTVSPTVAGPRSTQGCGDGAPRATRAPSLVYFGTYEREYPRNALLIKALRRSGVSVVECHEPVWERMRDKSRAFRGVAALSIIAGLLVAYLRLVARYLQMPRHDALLVGYVGNVDMFVACFLSRLRGVPLIFNPMLSLYDTFCGDRALVRGRSLTGRLLWLLDAVSTRLADVVLVDTRQHSEYFTDTFGVDPSRIRVVPLGADDDHFYPRGESRRDDGTVNVLFIGKFSPLHGVDTILRAAALLRDRPVRFTIVGTGQEDRVVGKLIRSLKLNNVHWEKWVEYHDLPEWIGRADVSLGIFGTSEKARRVVPHKVIDALAVGQAVITGDSPAIRDSFEPGRHLVTVPSGDARALAEAIEALAADAAYRDYLGEQAQVLIREQFGIPPMGELLRDIVEEAVAPAPPEQVAPMAWGDHPGFFGPRHRFRQDQLVNALRRHLSGGRVLDAACGVGHMTRRLENLGYRMVGLDLSGRFLRHLQNQHGERQLSLLQGDITRIPLCDGSFDGIVAGEVLEHLEDDSLALREAARLLRPGGVLVISVPADPGQWHWDDVWAGHYRRYAPGKLQEKLAAAGFDMVESWYFGFPFMRYLYLPLYRRQLRRNANRLDEVSATSGAKKMAGHLLYGLFHLDSLFNRLPLGIGQIAVARRLHHRTGQ